MSSAGVISGTPVNADVGVYTVVVTATDDATTAGSVTDTFTLTVVNTNDATEGCQCTSRRWFTMDASPPADSTVANYWIG
ncbi:MAG: putative Ig domain-containing protein [Candidatus Thalassarchaeaceae archaeon]